MATRTVHQLIQHLSNEEGRTVFLCTHNMTEASHLCHRVAVVDHGRLAALGAPAELSAKLIRDISVHLEVRPEDTEIAIEILSDHHPVSGQTPGIISVSVKSKGEIPTVIAALVEAGVLMYRLEPREPTLEDVYLALYRGDRSV